MYFLLAAPGTPQAHVLEQCSLDVSQEVRPLLHPDLQPLKGERIIFIARASMVGSELFPARDDEDSGGEGRSED